MKTSQPVRLRALGLYSFCVFLAFLAGNYFSSLVYSIAIVLILYPVLSFFFMLASYFNLRLHQEFSNEHPVKGEIVEYNLHISNESPMPFPQVNVRFKSITPTKDLDLPEFSVFIKRKQSFRQVFQISCPFRGIYTVGLESVTVEDLLHFFKLKTKVWHKTFYVYPRILPLQYFNPGVEQEAGGDNGLPFGGDPDYAMFDKLKGYVPGESVKHIHWKKFAITGTPFMKEYDATPQPGVKIFFDLRKPVNTAINELEIEDTSVEILVAMVNYFLEYDIKTLVLASGRDIYSFEGKRIEDFKTFYDSTTSLIFQDTVSPFMLFKASEGDSIQDTNSIFFLTHILDFALFNLIQASVRTNVNFNVVFNQAGFTQEEKGRNMEFFNNLRNQGIRVIVVNNARSIIEDMESGSHG